VRVKVVEGDLLPRVAGGRTSGPGHVQLEGQQALVFFLGGRAGQQRPVPDLRGRTAEGRTFVLQGVLVESQGSTGGATVVRLRYQTLQIP
jgi:hypothetical protein